MTRRARLISAVAVAALAHGVIWADAPAAHADAPALQVAPLEYIDNLGAAVKSGYIDVSNPTDAAVSVSSRVQGFRQVGSAGDLDFFDDPDLAAAVAVGLPAFELGPREAIRVAFTINPAKLPQGAMYGVIFFHTVPVAQAASSSYVTQSASVGTLLELNNGAGIPTGDIAKLTLPFWQLGNGLSGANVSYRNTGRARTDAGLRPQLSSRVLPWGRATAIPAGLVLSETTRKFSFNRPGAYLGLLPVTVSDITGHRRTAWVLACTGWWRLAFPAMLLLAMVLVFKLRRHTRRHPSIPSPRRSLDGLASKPAQSKDTQSDDSKSKKPDTA